jgi:hypothetical protein
MRPYLNYNLNCKSRNLKKCRVKPEAMGFIGIKGLCEVDLRAGLIPLKPMTEVFAQKNSIFSLLYLIGIM